MAPIFSLPPQKKAGVRPLSMRLAGARPRRESCTCRIAPAGRLRALFELAPGALGRAIGPPGAVPVEPVVAALGAQACGKRERAARVRVAPELLQGAAQAE